jgi:CubicO group peptidase (beta-lactamase class C family)
VCLRPRPLRGGPVGRHRRPHHRHPLGEDTLQYVFSTSAHGYHAHTFGWLVGKVIRRITGRTPGTFFADKIATPLNLDAYIGLPPGHQHRVSRLIEPPAALHRDSTALRRASAVTRPRIDPNDPRVHAAEIPSSNGITTARAIARFYNTLIDPTDGYPLLAPATVTTPQSDALDQTLGVHTRFASATPCPPPHSPCSGPALSATAAAAAHSAAPTRPDINKIWVIEEVETFSQLCLGEQPASGHV